MHVRTVLFIIYHAIAIPLYILYIIELVLLKIRPEFQSSFYIFFFFGGVIDLLFYTLNVFVYQLAIQPWMGFLYKNFEVSRETSDWLQYSWICSIANLLMFYLPGIQDVVNILIASNRFCALCFPFGYRKIFTERNSYIMIPLGLLYGIIFVFPVIGALGFTVDQAARNNHTEPLYMVTVFQNAFPSISMSVYTSVITTVDTGVCLLLYCMIAFWICRLKLFGKTNAAELRMLLLGFTILLTNAPAVLYQMYWLVFKGVPGGDVAFQTLPWAILIKTLTAPLLLIATNDHIRKELMFLLPMKWRSTERKTLTLETTHTVIPVSPMTRVFVQ